MEIMNKKASVLNEVVVNYHSKEVEGIEDIAINEVYQAEKVLRKIWEDDIDYRERAYVLLLNRANKIIGYSLLSIGGTCGTVVDIKILFQLLLKTNASCFILAHSHPSGNLNPSEQDLIITTKIKEASKYLDIHFLDHIILTSKLFHSLANSGEI